MNFSIIIPAYNEEKYIADCLKSVASLSIPVGSSCEVIIVNNASTDNTARIARATFPGGKIVDEPRKGLTRAYNRGAREAAGDILVFIDADMILWPNHLQKIFKEFTQDSRLVVLSGPCIYWDGGKFYRAVLFFTYLFLALPAEIIFNRWLHVGASFVTGNSAVKKEAFDKVRGFNENIFYGLESEFAIRIKKLGKVRFKLCLKAESSARRFKQEGLFKILWRYIVNIVWLHFFHKPFTKRYIDVR